MANYKTNMWTGTNGLDLTGVFPEATANGSVVSFGTNSFFNASTNNNSELHGCTNVEARDDVRKFLWGILEQTYVAFTGGRNQGTPDKPAGNTAYDDTTKTGTGTAKVAKMTVAKSALSLVDEDTAKTTYTIVFQYAVDAPGASNLEVENE